MSPFELPSSSFKHHGDSEAFGEESPLACAGQRAEAGLQPKRHRLVVRAIVENSRH